MKKRLAYFVLSAIVSLHVAAQDRITGHNFATRSEVIARNGMAATSHPLATQVALDILKSGGSAVDALIPQRGALSVSVPGTVDGWFEMHEKFGKLSMPEILQPVIEYAREGFPVTELIAYYLHRSAPILSGFPNFSETYMPDGRMPEKGELFRNPYLANTYETNYLCTTEHGNK